MRAPVQAQRLILHYLDPQGGFTAADWGTGIAAYAVPWSDYALVARKDPVGVAAMMIKAEGYRAGREQPAWLAESDRRLMLKAFRHAHG